MELELLSLSKNFKEHVILKEVSFRFDNYKIYGVVGPNGIGKTTLFKCMVGLTNLSGGEVFIDGETVTTDQRDSVVQNVSYLLSSSATINHLTGWENVKLFAELYKIDLETMKQLFVEFDLYQAKDKKVKTYSLGMKQRLSLIISLINVNRKVIILDEPYLGLDPTGINILNEKLMSLRNKGYLIIVSNHQLHESEKIFDEVIFLTTNKLVNMKSDKTGDLSETYHKFYVEGGKV